MLLDGTRQRVLVYHTFMAKSKPRTQPTGILDIVKDIVSPWLGTPPAQNRSVTQAQGLARSAAETLDQTFAGGMVKAGVQGNKALVKQAAVNVAALGTGYIAGKAIQTGIVPRAVRAVTGRNTSYFVHGSPTSNIRKLDPKYETMSNTVVSEPRFSDRWPGGVDLSKANVYGQPITKVVGQKGSANVLQPQNVVQANIKDAYGYGRSGSLYIAEAPRQKVGFDADDAITSTAKVVKEIKVNGKTSDQVVREAEKALRKLGFRYPKRR